MKQIQVWVWVIAMGLLSGCGGAGTAASPGRIDDHRVVSGGIQAGNERMNGTGTVLFSGPLNGVTSKHSFALEFSLEDGGSLALHSNATPELKNGLVLEFSRSGAVLSAKFKHASGETDVSSAFSGVDATGTVSILVDIHNDESPAHVLAWTGSVFSEDEAVLNSEEEGMEAPGNGSSQYWGLVLNRATVTRAALGNAKFME